MGGVLHFYFYCLVVEKESNYTLLAMLLHLSSFAASTALWNMRYTEKIVLDNNSTSKPVFDSDLNMENSPNACFLPNPKLS